MPRTRRWEALAAALVAAALIGWLLLRGDPSDAPRRSSPALTPADPPSLNSASTPTTASAAAPAPSSAPAPLGDPSRAQGSSGATVIGAGEAGAPSATTPGPPRRTGRILGRVERLDGSPVAAAVVKLQAPTGRAQTQSTNSHGKFEFQSLPLGRYHLIPAPVPTRNGPLNGLAVHVRVPRPGATAQALLRLGPVASLEFVPPPQRGDKALLKSRLGVQELDFSDADLTLSGLPLEPVEVFYKSRDGRTATGAIKIQPGPNRIRLDLRGPGHVVVDARDPTGKRVEVAVKFHPLGLRTAISDSDDNLAWIERTEYTIRRERALLVPAGRYLITSRPVPPGWTAPSAELTVTGPGRLVVPLRLRPATTVEVALEQPWKTGAAIILGQRGWSVEEPPRPGEPLRISGVATDGGGPIVVQQGQLVAQAQISPGARPSLRFAKVGSVRVVVSSGGLPAGAGVPVRFASLRPIVRIDRSGRPAAPQNARPSFTSWTDGDGRVTRQLYPGRWKVEAEGESIEVTVPTRITVDVALPLKG